jgi:2-polyprenyl-3-methyl-5-hydroxy-6-metoxy-1,4-benzoquinol methylase
MSFRDVIRSVCGLKKRKGLGWLMKAFLTQIFLSARDYPAEYYNLEAEVNPKSTQSILYEMLGVGKNHGVVIDIGCGNGKNLSLMKDGGMAIGVEISRVCAYEIKKHAHAVIADAQQLPFKSSTVDVIIASEVLEHLKNPRRA